MKVVTAREQLLNAVQIVQRAVSVRNPMPILAGIKLEAIDGRIFLTATDLDMGIRCSFEAEITEPGACVLPARYISELVRRLPADLPVLINAEEGSSSVTIQYGQSETSINGYPAEEFPDFPIPTSPLVFDLPIEVLRSIVRQVVFAAANNENRPVFTGVLFELADGNLQVIATDTYRLAWRRLSLENYEQTLNIIIPAKTLTELIKIIEPEKTVNITVTPTQILFKTEDTWLISRLIEGQFPNYRQVIPQEYYTRVRLKTRDLAEATERASLLADDNSPVIKISLDQNILVVSVNNEAGRVHEEIPVFHEGESFQVAFNARYLNEALKAVGSEEINLEFTGPLSPGVIKPVGDQDYLSLLLPVRLRGA